MRETRLYGLFVRNGKKWERIGALAFRKSVAVRLFQTALLNGSMQGKEMALRPVAGKPAPEGWESV
jgi:hypothetical protein